MKKKPVTELPNTNGIVMFFHCANCMKAKPPCVSPREWAQLEVGWTKQGLQVWCKRCEANVMHIHFEGKQHPANLTRAEPPDEQSITA